MNLILLEGCWLIWQLSKKERYGWLICYAVGVEGEDGMVLGKWKMERREGKEVERK